MERSLRTSRLAAATLALGLAASLLVALSPARAGAQIPYPDTERISAGSAVAAGVGVSKRLYGNGEASSVVLVRKDKFPDGLAAAGIAGEFDGPVLFSSSSQLDSATEAEIRRVLPKGETVYLMGGKAALSDAVANKLSGDYTVRRADGTDRVHTAALAALRYTRSGPDDTAILVRGYGSPGQDNTEGWVDAISCGGFAAENGTPVLLTNNTVDQVHQHTLDALSQLNIRTVSICGGFGAVPKSQSDQLLSLGYRVNRYAGTTRIGTAIDVSNRLWGKGGSTVGDDFILVNGWSDNFAYGIAASPLSASLSAPILLVNNNDPSSYVEGDCPNPPNVNHETLCYLDNRGSDRVGSLTVVGSTALVSDAVFTAAAEAGGLEKDTTPPPAPGGVEAEDTPEDDGTNMTVSWNRVNDPQGGSVTYRVYYRDAEAEGDLTKANASKHGPVSGNSTVVGGLTEGNSYDAAVAAIDRFGNESALSDVATSPELTDEAPGAPTAAPNVQPVDPFHLLASWIPAPEADTAQYILQRAGAGTSNPLAGRCDPQHPEVSYTTIAEPEGRTNTSHTDKGVTEGDEYCYRYAVVDSTSNASDFSPPGGPFTAQKPTSDTTPPSGTPAIYAVNFDQAAGLVGSAVTESRSSSGTIRVDVVVPGSAFAAGETAVVKVYDDGTLRGSRSVEATGAQQVVSVEASFPSSAQGSTRSLNVLVADAAGNEGKRSTPWPFVSNSQFMPTPRITHLEGVDVDPLSWENARIPTVGGINGIDNTPSVRIEGLSPSQGTQLLELYVNGNRRYQKCLTPDEIAGGNYTVNEAEDLTDFQGVGLGDNNIIASVTRVIGACNGDDVAGGSQTPQSTRSGDSNTVLYVFDPSKFGILSRTPAPGVSDPFGFDTFEVVFNAPATAGSTLTVKKGSTVVASARNDNDSDASKISFTTDDELTDGTYTLAVDATAVSGGAKAVATSTFTAGFTHLVYVSRAVNASEDGPPSGVTLVVDAAAPSGTYTSDVTTPATTFTHTQGSQTRQSASNPRSSATEGDSDPAPIQWTYREDADSVTGQQPDGLIPVAVQAEGIDSLGLRTRGDGPAFELIGSAGADASGDAVWYVPTTTNIAGTSFQGAPVVAIDAAGARQAIPNDRVRTGWRVDYFVRNPDGNESQPASDGSVRRLLKNTLNGENGGVTPANNSLAGNVPGRLEAGDTLQLTFQSATSLDATKSPPTSANGGVNILADDQAVLPRFGAAGGSTTSVSGTSLTILFGSATTVGGTKVPVATQPPTSVHGGASWFGVNWLVDTTHGHAVLLPPSSEASEYQSLSTW